MDWAGFARIAFILTFPICAEAQDSLIITSNDNNKLLTCYYTNNIDDTALIWKFTKNDAANLRLLRLSKMQIFPYSSRFSLNDKNGWNTKYTTDYPNIQFGPITDMRWDDLEAKNVLPNSSVKVDLKHTGRKFEKYFSILARNPIDVTIMTANGTEHLLQIGHPMEKKENSSTAVAKVYLTVVTSGKQKETKEVSASVEEPDIVSGLQWTEFKFSLDASKATIEIKNKKPISFDIGGIADSLTFTQKISGAFHFIKVHDIQIMVAPENGTVMKQRVNLQEEVCIAITYFSQNRPMNLVLTDQKGSTHKEQLPGAKGKWQVKRIQIPSKRYTPYWEIQIQGKSQGDDIQAIGAIRSCRKNEYFYLTLGSTNLKVAGCEDLVQKQQSVTLGADKLSASDYTTDVQIFEKILDINKTSPENVSGLKFCGSHGCSCTKGFSGSSCTNDCMPGYFGYDCRNKCGKCLGNKCSLINGRCANETFCEDHHRPPICKNKLISSEEELKIEKVGSSFVEVDISKVLETLAAKTLLFPDEKVAIDYLLLEAKCDPNKHCPATTLPKRISWGPPKPHKIQKLEGLNSQKKYSLQLFVVEKNVQEKMPASKKTEIDTISCKKSHINDLKSTNTTIIIKWAESEDLCPPQDYTVSIRKQGGESENRVGAKILHNLTPDTEYTISVSDVSYSKNVSTEEGAPETVEGLQTEVDGRKIEAEDSYEISATWRQPRVLNGKLKGYTVKLKHLKFLACGNTPSADSSLDQTKETTESKATFKGVSRNSLYHVIVTANSQKMQGQPLKSDLTFTANTSDIQAAPRIDKIETGKTFVNINWKGPDCTKAGCMIDPTYLFKFYLGNGTLEEHLQNTSYRIDNLTIGTAYSFRIEARCVGSDWSNSNDKAVLVTIIKTDQFDAWEIVGIVCGSLVLLILISALIFVAIKKYRGRETGYIHAVDKNDAETADDKLQMRYLPAPKKQGQLVKRENFASYVLKAKANGSLKKDFDMLPRGQQKSWAFGMSAENKNKNRYAKLAAYDHTRVEIGDQGDYINANYINNHLSQKNYIATQGPLEKTTYDFWRMIWQEEVTTIVMLTKLVEKTVRCHKYWPNANNSETFGEYLVQTLQEHEFPDHVERTFSLTGRMGSREVHQLHYTAWPHQGVPQDIDSFARFMGKVASKNKFPLLIHCSGGTGRTGTVTLIDMCLRNYNSESMINVWASAERMRHERINMVETKEQYEFAHTLMAHYLNHYG